MHLVLIGGSIDVQHHLHLTALAEIVSMHSGQVVGGKKYADSLDTANETSGVSRFTKVSFMGRCLSNLLPHKA